MFSAGLLAPVSDNGNSFWLPKQASTGAADTDFVFWVILIGSAIAFAGIISTTIYFMIKYRRRSPEQRTSAVHGHTGLEVAWTLVPAVFFFFIFLLGFRGWMNLNVPPSDGLVVRVLAKKWNWSFSYPKQGVDGLCKVPWAKGKDGLPRDMPCLVVPEGRKVKLIMSSEDVIHSFFVPAFRIKRDVLPNRYSVLWFQAQRKGQYDIFCTEYCGEGHSRMTAVVRVVTDAEFQKWVSDGGGLGSKNPADLGKSLFSMKGCTGCHSTTADRRHLPGPAMHGVYGRKETLTTGQVIKVDDNYIRESIMKPNAKVLKGYVPVMPTYAGQLSDKQINALIEYLKSITPGAVKPKGAVKTRGAAGKPATGGKPDGAKGTATTRSTDGAKKAAAAPKAAGATAKVVPKDAAPGASAMANPATATPATGSPAVAPRPKTPPATSAQPTTTSK